MLSSRLFWFGLAYLSAIWKIYALPWNFTSNEQNMLPFAIEYFLFHGIGSLHVIVCPTDIENFGGQIGMTNLAKTLMERGLVMRIHFGSELFDKNQLKLVPSVYKEGIFIVNLNSSCARNTLRQSTAMNYFTTNRFWLLGITSNDVFSDDVDVYIPPDGEVRLLLKTSFGVELIDVYKVTQKKSFKRRSIGSTMRNVTEMIEQLKEFGSAISYRWNLEGIRLNTGLVIAFPQLFTNINDVSQGHIDVIAKVNFAITKELGNKLNITFNTFQTDNFGWRLPNGSFDGLMGRFQRFEVDFAQNALFMRLDRVEIVDFVAETFLVRAGIIFRQPPLSAVENIFAMPFNFDVWMAIVLFGIFITAGMVVVRMFSLEQLSMDIWDCGVFVWGAIWQQSFHVPITSRSGRVLVLTTFLSSMFLFNSFSANIVALLQSPSESIRSLSDLSHSPLAIGVQDTVYNKESTDPVTVFLYQRKIQPKGDEAYVLPDIGIERMRTGLYAYQVELQAGYRIISDTFSEPEKCGLKELEPFQLPITAIPVRKNFPYKELFRRQLRLQREVGLMNHEERKWLSSKPKCESNIAEFTSIGITECRHAFRIFALGIGAAFLMLLSEFLIKKLTDQWKINIISYNEHEQF